MTNYNEPLTAKKFTDTTEVNSLTSGLKGMAEKSSNLISNVKDEVATAAKDGKDYLKTAVRKDIQAIEEYVVTHPAKSLGYAILTGFLVSKIFGHSRR